MSNKTTNAAALPGSDLSMRKIASPHSLVATSLALAISGIVLEEKGGIPELDRAAAGLLGLLPPSLPPTLLYHVLP